MAQSSTARTPESIKNELLAAKLLQQSAAANTGPYTSGGVTALKALSGLMGGLQERQAEQANAQGQAQSNAVLAAALKAYAANRNGPAPTFGDAAAASAATSSTRGIPTSAAASAPMSSDARDLAIRTIYGEAGGEPDTGKAGVAAVLKNRLAGGQYGGDMQSVILAPKQFSLWNKGDPAGDNARKLSADSPSYQKIGQIYDGVMSGQIPDPTGGATHYYNPNVASPGWGPKLAQQNDVRIGNHRFVGTGPAGPNGGNTTAFGRCSGPQRPRGRIRHAAARRDHGRLPEQGSVRRLQRLDQEPLLPAASWRDRAGNFRQARRQHGQPVLCAATKPNRCWPGCRDRRCTLGQSALRATRPAAPMWIRLRVRCR